ncbi:MAG: hypothetical protein V4736_06970 [Bdellovibrionota bacterium]
MNKLFSILLSTAFVTVTAQADQVLSGTSLNSYNLDCSDPRINLEQQEEALKHLNDRVRMVSGKCAYAGGYVNVYGEPNVQFTTDASRGCRVTASVAVSGCM